jgi:hypothetical protein
MPLPQAVSVLVTERLAAVDAVLPGLVSALWVTGSAVSGDWRPGRSDVDFIAATSRVPTLAGPARTSSSPSPTASRPPP